MPQDIFDRVATKPAAKPIGDIFDRIATKPAAPAVPVESSISGIIGGALPEMWDRTKRLVSAASDTTGDPNILTHNDVLPMIDSAPAAVWNGVRSLPGLVKASPGVQTAVALKDTAVAAKDFILNPPRKPIKAMIQALKPTAPNLEFAVTLERSLPEVKAIEAQLGKPIEGVEDLAAGIKLAKKNVRAQIDQIAGPQRLRQVDGSPIADAMERSISGKLKLQDPAKAAEIQALADKYRKNFTIEELEDFLTTTNAELEGFYGKYPAARSKAERANPEIAHTVAEAKSLRDTVYKALDIDGSEPVRELQRRYGSLMNLEKETQRRVNVAARQQPESLSEQMAKWHAAGKATAAVTGAIAGTAAGGPLGGVVGAGLGLSGAMAEIKVAKFLRERQSTDALIKNVFEHYTRTPVPVNMATWKPTGLIGERAGAPFISPEVPPKFTAGPEGTITIPWEEFMGKTPKQLGTGETAVRVTGTVQPSSGRTIILTGVPPKMLESGRFMLPEKAGSPFITPPPKESLREYLRRTGKLPKK